MSQQGQQDPARVAALQRRYSGLDNQLTYLPGHTIARKYDTYKAADTAAGSASKAYRDTAKPLKQTKPYATAVYGPVGGGMYSKDSHRTLDPLAGTAATAAQ